MQVRRQGGAARQHRDAGEHVEREGGLAREQGVEEARDVGQAAHVVGEHGQRVGEGEVGLGARQAPPQQRRVRRRQQVRDQPQLRHRRPQARQHEVPEPQRRQPRRRRRPRPRPGAEEGGGRPRPRPRPRRQHQQQHLADVVVALEVAQVRLPPQHLGDEVRELGLLRVELRRCVV